jgi:hypothetical protein
MKERPTMLRFDTPKASSRGKRPGVEALETRDLLASVPLAPIPSGSLIESLPAVQYAESQLYGTDTPLFAGNPMTSTITEGDGTKIPTPQPSANELHREFFEFKGFPDYSISAPRFTGQEETIHASGTRGGSNQFLNGRPQMVIFPSTNPDEPATGVINITASNILESGASIVLDLTETKVNAQGLPDPNGQYVRGPGGLPENFTWTLDPVSGEVYTGSSGTTPNPAYAAIMNPYYAELATYYIELATAKSNGTAPPAMPAMPTTNIPATIPGPVGSGTGAGVLSIVYRPSSTGATSGKMTINAMGLTNLPGINNLAQPDFS